MDEYHKNAARWEKEFGVNECCRSCCRETSVNSQIRALKDEIKCLKAEIVSLKIQAPWW